MLKTKLLNSLKFFLCVVNTIRLSAHMDVIKCIILCQLFLEEKLTIVTI